MNVLHFSAADNEGGSGRSAYRIHGGLRDLGWTSRMLVGLKTTQDGDVDTVHDGTAGRIADRIAEEISYRAGFQSLWHPSGLSLSRHPWVRAADILQLYNIHGGWLGTGLLPGLAAGRPIVWRLSDMWPMTGHCAYAGDCQNWLDGCRPCPDIAAAPALTRDTAGWHWRWKRRIYQRCDIHVVAPSQWIADVARRSPLFGRFPLHVIANGLDLSLFRPMAPEVAREVLNLDRQRRVILFAAQHIDDNPRKGAGHLLEALTLLGPRDDVQVLLIGQGGLDWQQRLGVPVTNLGYVRDDRLLAVANAAADLVVVPSTAENLPNTVVEAAACGRPVIAYAAGGILDGVIDNETGLLVPAGAVTALSAAIARLLDHPQMRQSMGERARILAQQRFDARTQAQRFSDLYGAILGQGVPG